MSLTALAGTNVAGYFVCVTGSKRPQEAIRAAVLDLSAHVRVTSYTLEGRKYSSFFTELV